MKLSIVLSTQPASFSALAYKGRLVENIAKIKDLGYDAIELAVRDPDLLDLTALTTSLSSKELPVSAIGTGQAYGEEGLSFTHPNNKVRLETIDRVKAHIKLADRYDAVVIIGLVRGKIEAETTSDRARDWLVESLKECASYSNTVRLAIEPINRYETNLINTVKEGLDLVNHISMDNIGLLLDTFHMNIEEPSLTDSIASAGDRLFHFHIADSNRWYPGAGHIDFQEIISALSQVGYNRFVSAEILPQPDSDTAAEMTIKNMKKLFNQLMDD
jgi:sugar phosphate isomerase/epimerase